MDEHREETLEIAREDEAATAEPRGAWFHWTDEDGLDAFESQALANQNAERWA